MAREVLLTGTVPRSPAAEVFRLAERHLKPYITRIPDGEQGGWGGGDVGQSRDDPQLQPGPTAPMTTSTETPFGQFPELTLQRLADGVEPHEFTFTTRIADLKIASYGEFRGLKAAGEIPQHVRFQATLPGPATMGGTLYMPLDVGARTVGKALIADIEKIAAAIPHDELAIQLDLAVELESVELQRRPDAFAMPIFKHMFEGWGDWTFDDMVGEVVRVANAVPPDVELGFHLCGCWHIDPAGGQDISVHVDWANALTERVDHPIAYIHMASIPEHRGDDYAPLADLRLKPDTTLFLGVVHQRDGIEGARRRIADASQYVDGFGVAHFCGISPVFGVDPATVEELLSLHAQAAES